MPKIYNLIQTARRNASTSINLAKRRAWYADGDAGDQQQQGQQQDAGDTAPKSIEDWQKYAEALRKRVDERDQTIMGLRTSNSDMDKRLKAIETAQRVQLEQDGNFKALAQQHEAEVARLKPIEERAAALEKIIRESNEGRIAAVPERMRSIIPADYPPEKLQNWLNANASLLTQPPAPEFNAGAGGSGGGNTLKVTDEDRRQAEIAQANGHKVKPEDIARRRIEMAKADKSGNKQ